MNTIELDLYGTEPLLSIKIDGISVFSLNGFKREFLPVDVPAFLFNEYMWSDSTDNTVFNGTMLIGVCTCGCQGCNDFVAEISSSEKSVTWNIMHDRLPDTMKSFTFDYDEYEKQVNNLTKKYYTYSWETEFDKFNRVCTEYIREYLTKDNKNIEGVKIKKKLDKNKKLTKYFDKTIEVYYYDDWVKAGDGYAQQYKDWKLEWDGKTLKNALEVLKQFAQNNLVKNPNKVNLRPQPFRLLYTKDEEQLKKLGLLKG
jgi:hypothetical protein